jgi:hypothetical protein
VLDLTSRGDGEEAWQVLQWWAVVGEKPKEAISENNKQRMERKTHHVLSNALDLLNA